MLDSIMSSIVFLTDPPFFFVWAPPLPISSVGSGEGFVYLVDGGGLLLLLAFDGAFAFVAAASALNAAVANLVAAAIALRSSADCTAFATGPVFVAGTAPVGDTDSLS